MKRLIFLPVCLFLLSAAGCESYRVAGIDTLDDDSEKVDSGSSGQDAGSDSDSDSDIDSDSDSDTDSDTCHEDNFEIAVQPVDLLIVLDRSNSMCDDGYWDPMGKAIKQVVNQMLGRIRFGLMVFPTLECHSITHQCDGPFEPSEIPRVKIGGSEDWIKMNVGPGGVGCCGGTPTAETLITSLDYLDAVNDGYEKYVLLATDGAPNCNDALSAPCECTTGDCTDNGEMCLDDQATIDAADAMYQAGYPVYVLSIGSMSQWTDVMDDIASAGGTGTFYNAQSDEFVEKLNEITGQVISCDYNVDWETLPEDASTDPSLVNLYCKENETEEADDDNIIKFDKGCANGGGWDWSDDDTITFCPDACEDLKSGACEIIMATFGCKSVPIE